MKVYIMRQGDPRINSSPCARLCQLSGDPLPTILENQTLYKADHVFATCTKVVEDLQQPPKVVLVSIGARGSRHQVTVTCITVHILSLIHISEPTRPRLI
eukprot:6394860-Amphidinium_carterae.1